jgi:bacteriocin biosynthesis cyclodehydratase domain-containing protein
VLTPFMTGENTLDAICDGLEPGQRELVTRLVDTLLQRGVLKNHIPEAPDQLPKAAQNHFKSQIEFIDHFVERPIERFKAFRESRILLIGSGESFLSLATTLIRNGVQEILLASSEEMDSTAHSTLEREVEALCQKDIEAKITLVDIDALCTSAHLGTFEMVAYCSDCGTLEDVLVWQRRCHRDGLAFLPAVVFGKQAILGPLVEPQGNPCWLCAQMRLSANAEEKRSAAMWRELALGRDISSCDSDFFIPQARRIGNGLAFELFKIITQALSPETRGGIILQDLETLESYYAPLIPHPLCPSCSHGDVDTGVQRLQDIVAGKHDKEFATKEDMLHLATPLINKWTGIFKDFSDDKLTQIPLKVSNIEAAPPASPLAKNIAVTTFSAENLLEARFFALLEATVRYTQSLPDKRMMLVSSLQELKVRGLQAIPAQQLITGSGASTFKSDTICEWSPAFALFSQCLCYVPAAAVYPSSWLNRAHLFEKTTAGSGAAANFHDLLINGMLSALAYEELYAVTQGRTTVVRLASEVLEGIDPDLTFLVHCASHFERPFTLLEVQSETPLHLFLACTTDITEKPITAVGFALSASEAIKRAFTSLIGQLQHFKYEGNIPVLDEILGMRISLSADLINSDTPSDGLSKPEATPEQLKHYLREKGREALFINLTTADIWEKGPFISGTILLTQTTFPNTLADTL